MRKALLFIAAICCLSSCMVNQSKIQPIRDKYPLYPTERVYSYSYDDVWSNVIDFFATNGLSIKIIDKQSGLILSEKVSFMDVGTYEKYKEPGVSNPNAFVVIERKGISPNRVDGEWNVRVKKVGDKTSVKVNIVQLRADYVGGSSLFSGTVFDVRSTGVFEKMILDGIEGK